MKLFFGKDQFGKEVSEFDVYDFLVNECRYSYSYYSKLTDAYKLWLYNKNMYGGDQCQKNLLLLLELRR